MAGASIPKDANPFLRRLGAVLNGDLRGIPVVLILMMFAGIAAGGVAALTTHIFENSEPVRAVAPPHH